MLLYLSKTKLPKIKFDIIKVTVNKTVINFAFDGTLNKMTAGTKKIVITNKFKEYVPTYDKIWINSLIPTKLKEIKFQGKPPNIWPLKYSIIENIKANKKILTIFFLGLK